MSKFGFVLVFVLYISGIHTIPKPLDTVNINLNIDENEPLGRDGGGVAVGGGQLEGAREQATGKSYIADSVEGGRSVQLMKNII